MRALLGGLDGEATTSSNDSKSSFGRQVKTQTECKGAKVRCKGQAVTIQAVTSLVKRIDAPTGPSQGSLDRTILASSGRLRIGVGPIGRRLVRGAALGSCGGTPRFIKE